MPKARTRTPAERDRDFKALAMANRGWTHRQIAAELGWRSHTSVGEAVGRALREINRIDGTELVGLFRERLDDYRRQAWLVLGRKHYVTSASGHVVLHPDTKEPLVDDAPILAALDRLLRYDVEERKMLGVDAPTKHSVQVITESDVDAEIRRLSAKLTEAAAEGVDLASLLEDAGESVTG